MPSEGRRILSPVRLPVPSPRHQSYSNASSAVPARANHSANSERSVASLTADEDRARTLSQHLSKGVYGMQPGGKLPPLAGQKLAQVYKHSIVALTEPWSSRGLKPE